MTEEIDGTVTPARFTLSTPRQALPALACDCHVHVFGPRARFPFSEARNYTPMDALPADLDHVMRQLGLSRVVIVQASVYGTDNRCLLDALATTELGARGVAMVSPRTQKAELVEMHDYGVRGIRLVQPMTSAATMARALHDIGPILPTLKDLGWHLDFYVGGAHLNWLAEQDSLLDLPIVVDHAGGPAAHGEPLEHRIDRLKALLATGRVWIKLSGFYRLGRLGQPENVSALAEALLRENPERLIWGSDWPHTPQHDQSRDQAGNETVPFRGIDTGLLLEEILATLGSDRHRQVVLSDNPGRLYHW